MSVVTPAADVERRAAGSRSDRRAERVVRWSLRLFGSIDLLAIVAIIMPVESMRAVNALCGLGDFPGGPLPVYLARSTSMVYAFHGAILWSLSTDVRRYCPLIRFVGIGTIICGLTLIAIDLSVGLPLWWTWSEGPVFAASGIWLITWISRLRCEGCEEHTNPL